MGMPAPPAVLVSINISQGGIPKRPVKSAQVIVSGLAGDGHDHAKHNTPTQAISLIDLEDLHDLAREGFPVGPGATGENLTVSGLNVDRLGPGDVLQFSGGTTLEITRVRQPCFVLDSIDPQLKLAIRGRCGVLAKVIRTGTLVPGETILLQQSGGAIGEHPERRTGERSRAMPTGVILAGGLSTRMGQAKHALRVGPLETMLEHVRNALQPLCRSIEVVGRAGDPTVQSTIVDRRESCGPLAGIEAALASARNPDGEYLVCPCDLPRITSVVLAQLLAGAGKSLVTVFECAEPTHAQRQHEWRNQSAQLPAGGEVNVVSNRDSEWDSDWHPLPCRIHADALPQIRAALDAGDRSVRLALARMQPQIVKLDPQYAHCLHNVNTPADYQALLAGSRQISDQVQS
jgi:molybdopterin-guanine dinucleotide biosynthesis protein A/MOSC domain-containing protein YiiM